MSESFFITIALFVGFIVGSFLNVVAYRLPLMLKETWRKECLAFLKLPEEPSKTSLNLAFPASHCPYCQHPLRFFENIPILSYLFLQGKCSQCNQSISIQYPLVELLSGVLCAFLVWHFGINWHALAAIFLSWGLLVASLIDLHEQILPDELLYSLLWLGLIASLFDLFTGAHSAIIGAVLGYGIFWLFAKFYALLTKREGMGHGDFKLLAVLGAWLGYSLLPFVIIFSSLAGSLVGIVWLCVNRHTRHTPIPFGPFLALAGWIALLFGAPLTQYYLQWVGLA